jgi:hypothetical protein
MKKIVFILMGLMLVPMLAANHELLEDSCNFQIQSSSTSELSLSFQISDFTISEIEEHGELYHKIESPLSTSSAQTGMPDLPFFSTTIAIPATGGIQANLAAVEQEILADYNPYPVQESMALDQTLGFSKNAAFYSGTNLYPSNDFSISEPMILRDLRIITIRVNPFIYDSGSKQLYIRQNMEIDISFTTQPSINELPCEPQNISASFAKIYDSMILNFEDYRDLMIANTPPRYLIIHGNTTDATFRDALDDYVLWKRQKGADVDVASTSEAGTSNSAIQTYIRNRYSNPDTRPDFVILIGDTSGSCSVPAYTNNGGATDYPYTHMNTGDILGDVFIGRISAETTTQFLVLLQKIYLYERDIDLATADWLDRLLLAADTAPSGISTMYISKYIKEMAMEVNPAYTATEIYNSDFSSMESTINGAINQGVGFYSFRGFIDYAPPSESALFNGFKLLHAINITCATNNFNGSSEMEAFVRYGSTAAPKGAVTGIGMSTSSTHTTFNNVLHGGIFEGIYVHEMRTMGEAILHGKLYMNDIFGVSSPYNVEKFTHWCNLIGDPTMEVFTGIPNSFQIDTNANIPMGLTLLDVAVTDSESNSVEAVSVVLSQGNNILSRGYTDEEGNVILVLPETMIAGDATITLSAHNFKPLIHAIDIVDIGTLVPAEITIDDSQTGNDNGIITAGETVDLYFGLRNTGDISLNRISGILYTDSPWVNIIQGTVLYPPILPGVPAQNSNPIVIEVAANTPHDNMLRLHLLLGDGASQSFDVSEFIPVESAQIRYEDQQVLDAGNGILDAGESSQFNVFVKNIGAVSVPDIYAELVSDNDMLEIVQDTVQYGTLLLNNTVGASGNAFQVFCREQALPGMVMPMNLRLYNSNGFEQLVPFSITIGSVTEQDPLGPDSYGYVIYDWTDTSYLEAPNYEWIEIAPSQGGLGTALPISDVYNSYDEGDQVGAESLALVDLPFPFQFYGQLYDQITVCSNGFIALGETGNAEFRNFRLPGAMGPSPMIAAFWDDLATHSGSGIYTYFDRQNRSFIIEWHNMRNGYNGSSPETFQIILYDQNYYYTSLGDGPIKIQYHTFNNVNDHSGNEHGNYCTIGIEDHTGIRGLEYTFNNTYSTAAAELSDGTAIYITNNPSMYDAPVIQDDLANITLHQGENLLISDLEDYFYSDAYLTYSLADTPHVQALHTGQGLKLGFDPDFYGRIDLHLRATDPMGRYVEQTVMAVVHQAVGHYEDFDAEAQLPAGWSVNHIGTTSIPWQIVATAQGGYQAKTSTSPHHSANERLTTLPFDLTGFSNTRLRFYMDYLPIGNTYSQLQYSFNGFIWTSIDSFNSPYKGYKVYDLSSLDNSTAVRFRWTYVSAINSAELENHWLIDDMSITSMIPDTTSPTMVTDFQVTSQNMGNLFLSWNPSFDDFFSHYEIYISQNPSVGVEDQLYSVAEDAGLSSMETTLAQISGLAHGSYWAAIRAVDMSGNTSPFSNTVDFVLGAVPATVHELSISLDGNAIQLAWDEVFTDVSGNPMIINAYKIYGGQSPDFECNEDTLLDTVSEAQCSLEPNAQRMFYKVTALSN